MALILDIKVVPSSGRNDWKIDKNGRLKCYLKSPPERGLANKELVKLLADHLRIAQFSVEILAGATSRTKRVKIDKDITLEQLILLLGIEQQGGLFD